MPAPPRPEPASHLALLPCILPPLTGPFPLRPTRSADKAGAGGASASSLTDGTSETAWSDPDWASRSKGTWVRYKAPAAGAGRAGALVGLAAYSLTSAAEHHAADPRDWVVEARRGGGSWEKVDEQRNVAFSRRGQRKIFLLDGAAAVAASTCTEIRLRMTATQGGFRDGSFRNIFWGG